MDDKQSTMADIAWPEPKNFRKSLRVQFSIYVSAFILILMLLTGYIITTKYVASATLNVIERLLSIARSYSGAAGKHIISAGGPDQLMLSNICRKVAGENPEIFWAGVTDKNERFIAHTDIKQVIAARQFMINDSREFGQLLREGEKFSEAGDTLLVSIPIMEDNILLGHLYLASRNSRIIEARRSSITTVASITLLVIIIGIPITLLVVNRKLSPISAIVEKLRNIDVQNLSFELPFVRKDELGYLAETIQVMSVKLQSSQKQLIENERMAKELEIAREIQVNILPKQIPVSDQFEFACSYQSAKQVGGDYYDFIDFDGRHLGFLVADVSGKSLPGMLVMLLTRDIVRNLSRTTMEPCKMLSGINSELFGNLRKGMFVTMFYGLVDLSTCELRFASAGHNPLVKLDDRKGDPTLLKTKGFPLGLFSPAQFNNRLESARLPLRPSDMLVQYTDGVTEAKNEKHEEFGMDRFAGLLKSLSDHSPKDLIENVFREHGTFINNAPQYDDITIVAMKWSGRKSSTESGIMENSLHVLDR